MYVSIVCMCNILKPVLTYFNKQTLRQMKIPTSSFSCLWNVLLQNKNKKIFKERYYKALISCKLLSVFFSKHLKLIFSDTIWVFFSLYHNSWILNTFNLKTQIALASIAWTTEQLCWLLSHVSFSVTSWTVVCQAPLSMGFPRQEDWSA